MASRDAYFPVDYGDGSDRKLLGETIDRQLGSEASSTGSKVLHCVSVWTFSLIVLGLAVMFLFGICVGFYVRELQLDKPDVQQTCGHKKAVEIDYDSLGGYHDTLVHYIRGEKIKEFVEEFGTDDPVTGSVLEERLADVIWQEFNIHKFDSVRMEEFDVVITSPDPNRPNQLEVLHHNGTKLHHMVLTNEVDGSANISQPNSTLSEEWRHPYVVFSPSGQVQGNMVYAHYGRETDFLILQALGVDVQKKIVLLRLGEVSVADKLLNCQSHGALAVLLYWEPQDALKDMGALYNSSHIPMASAATYSADSEGVWKPTILCQTISSDQASQLLSLLEQDPESMAAPDFWNGSLASSYFIGGQTSGSIRLLVSVYNIPTRKKIKNIISTIQGTEEPDRYVIVGAPRSSLPGQPQDVIASTSILIQLSHSFHYVHSLHYWKPRRGVKLVSWGGAEFSNIGMLCHIQTHHHLLDRRAVAMIDLRQLAVGNESAIATVSPGFHQLIKEATFGVMDPNNPEQTLQMSWKLLSESHMTSEQGIVPLASYHADSTHNPFLYMLGVPVMRVQYAGPVGSPNTVLAMTSHELKHHYKFHIAAVHIMTISLLSLLDNQVLPYNLINSVHDIQQSVLQTSGILAQCSHKKENLYPALEVCSDLQRAAEAFQEVTDIFLAQSDKQGLAMVNNIKMMFERLFRITWKGKLVHVLYPTLNDGSITIAKELCTIGEITQVWNATSEFREILSNVLKEAVLSLRVSE